MTREEKAAIDETVKAERQRHKNNVAAEAAIKKRTPKK